MSDRQDHTSGTAPDPVEALQALKALGASEVSAILLAVLAPGQPVELFQIQPTEKATAAISPLLRESMQAYVDCEVIAYEPAGSSADGQVMSVTAENVPLLKQVIDDSDDLANLPLFEPRQRRLRQLGFAAMRVEADNLTALFVQSLKAGQVVARTGKSGFIIRGGVLDTPEGEVVMLTRDFVAVLTGEFVFFRDRKAFQYLFGLIEEMREQAAATFVDVTAELRIDGVEEMRAAVTGAPAMLGKMASIQRKLNRYPEYQAALTMPRLLAFVQLHPECGVEITGQGDDATFVFHKDPQRRFRILKLLDDDYLRSDWTTLNYEANSKSAPLG